MKFVRITSLLTLMIATAIPCRAVVGLETISKEKAEKEFGAVIRMEALNTNETSVWLEFAPKGRLKTFYSVQLEIKSASRTLVSAKLSPDRQTPNSVVFHFLTDSAHLATSRITVFYKVNPENSIWPMADGIVFDLAKFAEGPFSP